MSDWSKAVNEQIKRLARREITAATQRTRRSAAQHRRDIAALKRQIDELRRTVSRLQKQQGRSGTTAEETESGTPLRFRVDGLRSHRQRLGLSAKDYGQLIGVSALTVYNWESGKSKPRRSQLPKIAALRSLGKRDAERRLSETN